MESGKYELLSQSYLEDSLKDPKAIEGFIKEIVIVNIGQAAIEKKDIDSVKKLWIEGYKNAYEELKAKGILIIKEESKAAIKVTEKENGLGAAKTNFGDQHIATDTHFVAGTSPEVFNKLIADINAIRIENNLAVVQLEGEYRSVIRYDDGTIGWRLAVDYERKEFHRRLKPEIIKEETSVGYYPASEKRIEVLEATTRKLLIDTIVEGMEADHKFSDIDKYEVFNEVFDNISNRKEAYRALTLNNKTEIKEAVKKELKNRPRKSPETAPAVAQAVPLIAPNTPSTIIAATEPAKSEAVVPQVITPVAQEAKVALTPAPKDIILQFSPFAGLIVLALTGSLPLWLGLVGFAGLYVVAHLNILNISIKNLVIPFKEKISSSKRLIYRVLKIERLEELVPLSGWHASLPQIEQAITGLLGRGAIGHITPGENNIATNIAQHTAAPAPVVPAINPSTASTVANVIPFSGDSHSTWTTATSNPNYKYNIQGYSDNSGMFHTAVEVYNVSTSTVTLLTDVISTGRDAITVTGKIDVVSDYSIYEEQYNTTGNRSITVQNINNLNDSITINTDYRAVDTISGSGNTVSIHVDSI